MIYLPNNDEHKAVRKHSLAQRFIAFVASASIILSTVMPIVSQAMLGGRISRDAIELSATSTKSCGLKTNKHIQHKLATVAFKQHQVSQVKNSSSYQSLHVIANQQGYIHSTAKNTSLTQASVLSKTQSSIKTLFDVALINPINAEFHGSNLANLYTTSIYFSPTATPFPSATSPRGPPSNLIA